MYSSMLHPSGDLFADISQLHAHLDGLFGPSPQGSSIRAVSRAAAFPTLNVGTWAEALEIYAFAPGIDPATVEVSVEKSLLTISGSRAVGANSGPDVTTYARERFAGPFRRVVALPEDADPTRVEATYANGVLKIVIPKRESSKPRQIQVNSAR